MTLHRRALMAAGAAAALAVPQGSRAQQPPAPTTAAVSAKAAEVRLPLTHDAGRFSGPALDLLLREARAAQFFLVGEEHGIAWNPLLAAQLFEALAPAGYARLGIEISPPMATELDAAARGGIGGVQRMLATPGSMLAFFGMREEAQMIARVRAAAPGPAPALWGFDYEVGADRRLIALLEAAPKPAAAQARLKPLREASAAAWSKYDATHNPEHWYSFSGDPALVRAVRAAWPKPDARSDWVLTTLEETFEINRLWTSRQGWESNRRRTQFMRDNFLRHWRGERAAGRKPKVMFKMGANHLNRGLTSVGVWDLGTLLPEVAAIEGGRSFSVMVLPGPNEKVAVLDPSTFRYSPNAAKDGYPDGLEAITGQAFPDRPTLFDLRPLRPLALTQRMRDAFPALARTIAGFDALLVMTGSPPSQDL